MKLREVYKCEICGNIVEIVHVGGAPLVCCGEEMKLMEEQTEESSQEKHVPFIQKENGKVTVKIGENETHPMTEKHHIEWIELIADGKTYRQHLSPDDEPKAVFHIEADEVRAREYCNIHGLWKS